MKPLHQWSTSRLVMAVAAVVVVIILVLQLAERVFAPDESPRAETSAEEPDRLRPIDAVVTVDDDLVVVETSSRQRSRIRIEGNAEKAQALAVCIREELDRLSKEPFSNAERGQETVVLFGLRIDGHGSDPRVNRAVDKCMMSDIDSAPGLPTLPDLPELPDLD